jgi:hypothetical protein
MVSDKIFYAIMFLAFILSRALARQIQKSYLASDITTPKFTPIEANTADANQACRNINEKEVSDRTEPHFRMKFGITKKFGIQLTLTFSYAYMFCVL